MKLLLIRIVAIAVLGVSSARSVESQINTNDMKATLYSLIAKRLGLMKDVAAWKQENDVQVEDLEREKVVVASAAEDAAAAGLDPESVVSFFETQILAAKEIQYCWIDRWATEDLAPPAETPDLINDIRPELLTLGAAIIDALSDVIAVGETFHASDEAPELDSTDCLSSKTAADLKAALGTIRQEGQTLGADEGGTGESSTSNLAASTSVANGKEAAAFVFFVSFVVSSLVGDTA